MALLRAALTMRLFVACVTFGSWLVADALGLHPGASPGGSSTTTSAEGAAQPRVIFMFMAESGIPTEDIWVRFLRDRVQGADFEVRVHCTNQTLCESSIRHPDIFRLIPTVNSEYCTDLASPMLALLRASVPLGLGHPRDKFVLVAENAIPIKPFSEIRLRLTADEGSDFCIAPADQWLYTYRGRRIVKHHQWTVLSRHHASILMQNHTYGMEVFASRAFNLVNPEPCLDEYWAFGAIFGSVKLPAPGMAIMQEDRAQSTDHFTSRLEGVNGLNGGLLDLAGERSQENQGRCDTFIDAPASHGWFDFGGRWSDFAGVNFSNVSRILHSPDVDGFRGQRREAPAKSSELVSRSGGKRAGLFSRGRGGGLLSRHRGAGGLSMLQVQGPKGPEKIEFLTEVGLQALRRSQFLFARKIDPAFTLVSGMHNISLFEALEKHVFTE